ncbi:MAG: exosortase E/protease, VPEID-CTERM system [Pseudomonadota bacterium]
MPVDLTTQPQSIRRPIWNLRLALGLFLIELITIGAVFKHLIDFECRANWPVTICSGAGGVIVSAYVSLAALGLMFALFPDALRNLIAEAGTSAKALAVNVSGLVITLSPAIILHNQTGGAPINVVLGLWAVGLTVLTLGILRYIAPLARWMALLADRGLAILMVLGVGIIAPLLAGTIRPIWRLDTIADLTFRAVASVIETLGYQVEAYPANKVIGFGDFFVSVAPVCSGVEGIALVTIFVTLYLVLFRSELRFPAALLIYPIGILVSATLNIVRISVLLIFGLEGYPELAVGGFHSHAGWLMFTLIALGVVIGARTVPALQKQAPGVATTSDHRPALAFFSDPQVAKIFPFAIFMFSALLVQAFSQAPGVVYPLRALAMAAALLAFASVLTQPKWRISPDALIVGVIVGLGWVLIPYSVEDATPAYARLTGLALIGWMVARGIGTIVLVPIIEELFFRDYLEGKIRPFCGSIVAAIFTASLFAALHDRWIEAFFAGLAFSWVMRRNNRVTDAIVAHAVANLIVFGYAITTRQMHII